MSKDASVNILLVDDQPGKLLTYRAILEDLGENLIEAGSGREALEVLLRHEIAVVLIDVVMPDLDGFELASLIRAHPRFEHIAIIFISAVQISELDLLRGYEAGAVDYLPVPVVPDLLRAKVRIFVDLYRKTRQLERLNLELEQRVTERTAELAAFATMLRQSAEAARFCNFDLSPDATRVSDNFRTIWGMPADAPCDHASLLSHIHASDRALVAEGWRSIAATGGPFEMEFRVADPDGTIRWLQARGEAEPGLGDLPGRMIGVTLDITERRAADERQVLLMREVDHRAKNALSVVNAALRLTPRDDPDAFARVVEGRVAALARAHTLLAQGRWLGAELRAVVEGELAPFISQVRGPRATVTGPSVQLNAAAVQSFSMAMHELATNAAKYGALSIDGGEVRVGWTLFDPGGPAELLRFTWEELGGPMVSAPPAREGFGTTLLEATFARHLDGEFTLDWRPTGLLLEASLPMVSIRNADLPLGEIAVRPRALAG